MSHIWMSHVTHMNESCHTYEWVMSHIWMSHVTHMNESRHTYEWVMSHIWMSHVTYMNESCHTSGSPSHQPPIAARLSCFLDRWHALLQYVIRLLHTCDMTHSHVWHDSFICVTWLIRIYEIPPSCFLDRWHDSFSCVIRLIHMCDVTHAHVCHDSFICVTWRMPMCVMTHSYVWHDSFPCVTWLVHTCDMTYSHVRHDYAHAWRDLSSCVTYHHHVVSTVEMTHSYVSHDPFICVTCLCVIWLMPMCDMTHIYVWHYSYTGATQGVGYTQFHLPHHRWHAHVSVSLSRLRVTCLRVVLDGHNDSCLCVTWLTFICDMTHTQRLRKVLGILFFEAWSK